MTAPHPLTFPFSGPQMILLLPHPPGAIPDAPSSSVNHRLVKIKSPEFGIAFIITLIATLD